MWKASVRPIQTLLGTGVCHKKHRMKAPVVPALCNQPWSYILYYCNLCVLLFSRPDVFLPSASFSVHCSFD